MKKIVSKEAIRGILRLKIEEGKICGECQIGKQTKMSHPKSQHQTTSKVLELLHMDLMRHMQVESLWGKRYAYVVVDDFSRFTWVNFIKKTDVFEVFKDLCQRIQREKKSEIIRIRSDHGKEFENSIFADFCSSEGIGHDFSFPITPHSKMGLWNARTELSKSQIESCFMPSTYLIIYGLKQWTLPAIFIIESV